MIDNPSLHSLIEFISSATTPWQAAPRIIENLSCNHFKSHKREELTQRKNRGYYQSNEKDALIAWSLPEKLENIVIWASHLDSPSLKLKPIGDFFHQTEKGKSWLWSFDPYGSPILATWTNTPLFLAGRLLLETKRGEIIEEQVQIKDIPFVIEPLAIHLDRKVNEEGLKLNPQKHLRSLISSMDKNPPLSSWINDNYNEHQLIAHDLYACPLNPLHLLDKGRQLCSSRIDNLTSAAAMQEALIQSNPNSSTGILSIWANHEEIGSKTQSGAQSSFFSETIKCLIPTRYYDETVLFSIDGAHATHPNWTELSEPQHPVELGHGICVKHNTQGRYRRDFRALSRLKQEVKRANIPLQTFTMPSDLPCGSTIGPILNTTLGISSVDIGIAQLGMHAMREVIHTQDYLDLLTLLKSMSQ